jgi:alpha-amylase
MSPTLRLVLVFHNHQPVGNFDGVFEQAYQDSYRPFLDVFEEYQDLPIALHTSGPLMEWFAARHPEYLERLAALVAAGRLEIVGGAFYEPILPMISSRDRIGQISRYAEWLADRFGTPISGMWMPERVWEQSLASDLVDAGVRYTLLDDYHFKNAGLNEDDLHGYYITEDDTRLLSVFPGSERLRYLIPFQEPHQTIEYLRPIAERQPGAICVFGDDGEKFGVWPGTYAHVYEDGWLDRFLDRLLATDWLELATLADVVERRPPSGRVYLPTASYREMGEWALPADAARALEAAREVIGRLDDGERLAGLLRGGFWRAFLVKYPEVADTYWKMLRVSRAIHAALARRPDDRHLAQGQVALWRGQANDAYWHGVFGGCYLPHLRRAVKTSLLEAERSLVEAGAAPAAAWAREDANGDGHAEVIVRTSALAVTLAPAAGGMLTELGYFPAGLDVADVLARRFEAYHDQVRARAAAGAPAAARTIHEAPAAKEAGLDALLTYDGLRRGSLVEGFFESGGDPLDPVSPWARARAVLGAEGLDCTVRDAPDGAVVVLSRAPTPEAPLALEKQVTIRASTVDVAYRLRSASDRRLTGRFGVQWNLALTAGNAPDRYLDLVARPSLGSSGREPALSAVSLVDEWAGVEARLAWSPTTELAWGPVETVSVSEGGFERIYQGTALLLDWPVDLEPGAELALGVALTLAQR